MTDAPAEDGPAAFMGKARRACRSARVLLEADDADGACNRAYYAMFDAARAAIVVTDQPDASGSARTHRGVLRRFAERLVIPGLVSRDAGRLLRRAETLRTIADYRGVSVALADASRTVESAEAFLVEIERFLGDSTDGEEDPPDPV